MSKSKARFLAELLGADGTVKEDKSALDISGGKITLSELPEIPNSQLAHSSITLNGGEVSLGGSHNLSYTDLLNTPTTVSSFTNDSGYITQGAGDLRYLGIDAETLPAQTGYAGKFLTTNGTSASWATVDTSDGDTAFSWGDHSAEGYLTSFTETDPTVPSHVKSITTTNISNWDTAYGWGNHSTQNYATQTYVDTELSNLVDSSPATLDTLNELAAALGDDPNFATTVSTNIGTKVSKTGDTMTGSLVISQGKELQLRAGSNEDIGDIVFQYADGSEKHRIWDGGTGLNYRYNGSGSNKLFHDSYHPNADKWTTARTLSLTGDVTGSVSWDGSANASITATVANDSHTHQEVFIPDTRGASRAPSYYPDRYVSFDFQNTSDTGAGGDSWHVLQTVAPWSSYNNSHRQQQLAFTGTGGIKFRYATSDSAWAGWQTIWTSDNDGSGSGLDADLLDGYQGSRYTAIRNTDAVAGDWNSIFSTGNGYTTGFYQVENIGAASHTNAPTGVYTYGGVLGFRHKNSTLKLYASHTGDLVFQTGWNNDAYSGWRRILNTGYYGDAWTSGNDGSGSGLDADTVDGVHASMLLRATADDTFTGGYLTMDGDFKYAPNLAFYNKNNIGKSVQFDASGSISATGNLYLSGDDKAVVFNGHSGIIAEDNKRTLWSHDNGHITLSGAGSDLYLGFNSGTQYVTNNIKLSTRLSTSDGNTTILGTDGTLYYRGSDTDSRYASSSHNHDDRYYTESEVNTFINRGYVSSHSGSNLAVGWYTIATNTGDRASARFGIWDTNSGDHQSVTFYASHHFGTDSSNTLTVLDNSYYSGNPFRYIRIKDSGTYDGAALQIYIDDSSNAVNAAILGDNFQSSGWVLCDWVPDATTPPGVSNYGNFGERAAVDLNEIAQGGFATTGEIRSEGNLHVKGNVLLGGSPTTTNQARMIDFTGFDKEGTTDYSDRAYIQHTTNTAGHAGSVLVISSQNDSNDGIGFTTHASSQIKHNGHIMWDAGNDGSGSGLDADLLDGVQGSSYIKENEDRRYNVLRFTGEGGNSNNGANNYAIYQEGGAWSYPYPDLVIGYHVGIKIGGYWNYGGTRFYNDAPGRSGATLLMSVGNGDNHVRVTNNIYATGFIYNSDKALKENIEPLESSLDTILKLEGVKYTLKESGKSSIGFIAQDVEKVIPEFVEGKEGHKGVNYGQMVAVLVEAMKEQQKQIEELKNEIKQRD